MKALLILGLSIVLVSCSKEQTTTPEQTSEKAFVRVEAVDPDGEVIYSDVAVVR